MIVAIFWKGSEICRSADSEPGHFHVPTTTTSTTTPAMDGATIPVTKTKPRLPAETNAVHRTAMGIILIDDNTTADTDEDEIDLNADTAEAAKILSADFGDNNVHPMEEVSCSICLVNYRHGDRIQRNAFACLSDCDISDSKDRCDHVFHPECISNWIKTNTGDGECPICRRPFVLTSPV